MFFMKSAMYLSSVAMVMGECEIHEEGFNYLYVSDLGVAAAYNLVDIVDDLLEKGCDVNYNGSARHIEFSSNNHEHENHEDYEYEDYDLDYENIYYHSNILVYGYTPLHIAVTEGNKEMVEKLFNVTDINLDMETAWRETPLAKASALGFTEIMEELVDAGADVNNQDVLGCTPLHNACYFGHLDSVELLVKQGGTDVALETNRGETPLNYAASWGYTDIMEILVDAGADINQKNSDGETPLHAACKAGHFSAANILVTRGANLKTKTRGGDTPLLAAIASGDIKIIEMLIKAGADVNNGFPLHRALDTGDLDTARILINVGADVNIRHMQGPTPLHLATLVNPYSGHSVEDYLDILNLLLENGADASLKDDRGRTALDFAIYSAGAYPRGGKEIVKMLVFAEFQQE